DGVDRGGRGAAVRLQIESLREGVEIGLAVLLPFAEKFGEPACRGARRRRISGGSPSRVIRQAGGGVDRLQKCDPGRFLDGGKRRTGERQGLWRGLGGRLGFGDRNLLDLLCQRRLGRQGGLQRQGQQRHAQNSGAGDPRAASG